MDKMSMHRVDVLKNGTYLLSRLQVSLSPRCDWQSVKGEGARTSGHALNVHIHQNEGMSHSYS